MLRSLRHRLVIPFLVAIFALPTFAADQPGETELWEGVIEWVEEVAEFLVNGLDVISETEPVPGVSGDDPPTDEFGPGLLPGG